MKTGLDNLQSKKINERILKSSHLLILARLAGFEPANDGIRIRCLTAWR